MLINIYCYSDPHAYYWVAIYCMHNVQQNGQVVVFSSFTFYPLLFYSCVIAGFPPTINPSPWYCWNTVENRLKQQNLPYLYSIWLLVIVLASFFNGNHNYSRLATTKMFVIFGIKSGNNFSMQKVICACTINIDRW
jgi:hypothetical protein